MVCPAVTVPPGGGIHGGSEAETPAAQKSVPIAKMKPVGVLEIAINCPCLSGYGGPAWPAFCFLDACFGGVQQASRMLPFVRLEHKDLMAWNISLRILVGPDWPDKCLDLVVERFDYDPRRRGSNNRAALIRGGPHTSERAAVIGRARVRLLDALLIGDDDDDNDDDGNGSGEGADKTKRRRGGEEGRSARMIRTVAFNKAVSLNDWELPAAGEEAGEPRLVERGVVRVRMCLKAL
ncbi:hypothetical protein ACP70R_016354 [Stipagrostis hirtigluma subsp. patula]